MINPSGLTELSELRSMLADSDQRARIVRMWNDTKGVNVIDNTDTFEVNIEFAPIGANGIFDFIIELSKDAIREFMPDIKAGKFLTRYAEDKLSKFGDKWDERLSQLAERIRKPNEELFTAEQLKLMDDYLNFRVKEVLDRPSLAGLPPLTDPEFGGKYTEWLKKEKDFLRSIGLGRVRRENGSLETLERFCAPAQVISNPETIISNPETK